MAFETGHLLGFLSDFEFNIVELFLVLVVDVFLFADFVYEKLFFLEVFQFFDNFPIVIILVDIIIVINDFFLVLINQVIIFQFFESLFIEGFMFGGWFHFNSLNLMQDILDIFPFVRSD